MLSRLSGDRPRTDFHSSADRYTTIINDDIIIQAHIMLQYVYKIIVITLYDVYALSLQALTYYCYDVVCPLCANLRWDMIHLCYVRIHRTI